MSEQDEMFEYIENAYGRTFFLGQRVRVERGVGTVTGATHYVEVQLDGEDWSNNWHPSDVTPIDEGNNDESRLAELTEETLRASMVDEGKL